MRQSFHMFFIQNLLDILYEGGLDVCKSVASAVMGTFTAVFAAIG